MICTVCEKEAQNGKIYTLSPEAIVICVLDTPVRKMINVKQSTYWVCGDCLANPVRRFAETLLSMWDIFPLTQAQKIESICEMFRTGGIRLPQGVSLKDIRNELKRRAF